MNFKRDVHHYHIVEVEKGAALPELTGDLKEALKALQHNPAFQYLLLRFKNKRAGLSNAINEGLNLTEVQLRYLQAGIYWAGEFERDIRLLTQTVPPTRPAVDREAEEFEKVRANLSLVGQ